MQKKKSKVLVVCVCFCELLFCGICKTNRSFLVTVESSLSTTAKPTDLSRLASRSADDNAESNGQLRHLSLPGIASIEGMSFLG